MLRTCYERMADAMAEYRGYTVEVLSRMCTLRTLSVEHLIFVRARNHAGSALGAGLHAGIVGFSLATTAVQAIGTAVLTWYGWTLILEQRMTLGTCVAFMAYVALFTQPLTRSSRTFAAMQQSGTGFAAGSSCAAP